ncbi:MAG: hypothetical protein HYZ45_12800 [Burkholderiales bacterium]|nr:hypothetical protein [Burkholderiales bacterium]
MVQAQALSRAEQALTEIISLMAGGAPLPEFTRVKAKRAANASLQIDPLRAYTVLGLVAADEWDEAAIHRHFHAAIALPNSSEVLAQVHSNYAAALERIGLQLDASSQTIIASDLCPTVLSTLQEAINETAKSGQFRKAKELIETFDLRSPNRSCETKQEILRANEILQEHNLDDEFTIRCNEVLFALLRERKIYSPRMKIDATTIAGTIYCHFLVNLPLERVLELEDELTPLLYDAVPNFAPSIYWIGFDCLHKTFIHHEH